MKKNKKSLTPREEALLAHIRKLEFNQKNLFEKIRDLSEQSAKCVGLHMKPGVRDRQFIGDILDAVEPLMNSAIRVRISHQLGANRLACGQCNMGDAGPGVQGEHDPDCAAWKIVCIVIPYIYGEGRKSGKTGRGG